MATGRALGSTVLGPGLHVLVPDTRGVRKYQAPCAIHDHVGSDAPSCTFTRAGRPRVRSLGFGGCREAYGGWSRLATHTDTAEASERFALCVDKRRPVHAWERESVTCQFGVVRGLGVATHSCLRLTQTGLMRTVFLYVNIARRKTLVAPRMASFYTRSVLPWPTTRTATADYPNCNVNACSTFFQELGTTCSTGGQAVNYCTPGTDNITSLCQNVTQPGGAWSGTYQSCVAALTSCCASSSSLSASQVRTPTYMAPSVGYPILP